MTIDLTNKTTACFTGPRPKNLFGYKDREPYRDIVAFTASVLAELSADGVNNFISGGAQGFDQLAFWAVEKIKQNGHKVNNIVYIPFEQQPHRWSMQGLFSQQEYWTMLARADRLNTVSMNPTNTADAIAYLNARNHAMVADSDFVIAFLHGSSLNWQTSNGGTAECVRYAHSVKKPILALTNNHKTHWILPD